MFPLADRRSDGYGRGILSTRSLSETPYKTATTLAADQIRPEIADVAVTREREAEIDLGA